MIGVSDGTIHVTIVGAVIAVLIAAAVGATLWWMLHPPASFVQKLAKEAETELELMDEYIANVKASDERHAAAPPVEG